MGVIKTENSMGGMLMDIMWFWCLKDEYGISNMPPEEEEEIGMIID